MNDTGDRTPEVGPDELAKPTVTAAPELPAQMPASPAPPTRRSRRWLWLSAVIVLLLLAGGAGWYLRGRHHTTAVPAAKARTSSAKSTAISVVSGLQLDESKNYGNKYADGIVPVGDGKYVTDSPKQGFVYTCSAYARNLATDAGGAGRRGPWFVNNNTAYDMKQKPHVLGSVTWQADFTNTVSGGTRTIVTNDLPSHPTGIFPIRASDPAYAYDKNPNTISGQSFTYALAASPAYSQTPQCAGGQVGVMLTGVALFSAFDAGGRDAGAWEVQDDCQGHPQSSGVYHYHTLSSCVKDISVHTVLGYALDGFPITGPTVGPNNVLTSGDLDECHGITSSVYINGKSVSTYHYVMTEDFPYSVSCFRATPIQPPGQPERQAAHP